jgi:hypothetical protein
MLTTRRRAPRCRNIYTSVPTEIEPGPPVNKQIITTRLVSRLGALLAQALLHAHTT